MTNRSLVQHYPGIKAFDGAGVKLTRILGSPQIDMLDPFLLLDCFESDEPNDYLGGFPTHPHRGFETVTYLLNGRMKHKDSVGNEGVIEAGGVQWMTAGKGILHSEMPEQEEGLLKGFQLWVNLPASAKMIEPAYQEYSPETTPIERHENGTEIRVIAGETNQGTFGPVVNHYTSPTYMDIRLPAHADFEQKLPMDHNAFLYVIEGDVNLSDAQGDTRTLNTRQLGVLTKGDQVSLKSGNDGAQFLLIAGQPLNEPVARGGPFVMNTKAEILQAFNDFNRGDFS
ncbi:pirin family protein [Marinomonas sp. 2405UD66-6]|uniref:pirin family protein n=1 Tax=Marinomonas sp. 2405UD66-6 TaxID=3391834 RepID=UPI0039C967A2